METSSYLGRSLLRVVCLGLLDLDLRRSLLQLLERRDEDLSCDLEIEAVGLLDSIDLLRSLLRLLDRRDEDLLSCDRC